MISSFCAALLCFAGPPNLVPYHAVLFEMDSAEVNKMLIF